MKLLSADLWPLRGLPSYEEVMVGFVRQPLVFMLAAVAAVLLIGCCNVAILLLARATRRTPEIAVRNALGASGARLARMLLTESVMLALAGGALGEPPETGSQGFNAQIRVATPGYFETMGIPLVRGRTFDDADTEENVPAIIFDRPFAEQIFPDEDPLGRRVVLDLGEPWIAEVIGVVGGVNHFGPSFGRFGTMYVATGQHEQLSLDVVVRTDGSTAAAVDALRSTLAELDRQIPLAAVNTMETLLEDSVAQPRFRTLLIGVFAGTALLLAAAGLYGMLFYFVAERRREMGVRLALGADARQVVRLIVTRGMRLVLVGMALGILAAAALAWAVQALLFGVGAADPVSFAGVAAILFAVATAAA